MTESSPQRDGRGRSLTTGLMLLVMLSAGGIFLFRWWSAPSDVDRIYRGGVEAMQQSDLGAVQVAAEALAASDDTQAQVHLLEGFVYLRSGQLTEAAAEFQQALEHPQTAPMANMLAGEVLYRNRQFQDAIEALSAAIEQDSSLVDAHRRMAAVLYDIGATEEAVKHLKIVSQQAPDDPRPHRMMGLIYKDMESYELAIAEYREALRRDPNLLQREKVLFELASCLVKTRQFEDLAEIAADCPSSADMLTLQAEAQFKQGKATEATTLVADALRLTPDHLEALLMKGAIELSQRNTEAAAATLTRAAKLHPMDYRICYKLSQAYTRLGQNEQAEVQSQRAEQLRDLRSRFADLHAKASVDTGNADLRYQLGVMARELQLEDLAMSWFAAAVALDPKHSAARAALRVRAALPIGPVPPSSATPRVD